MNAPVSARTSNPVHRNWIMQVRILSGALEVGEMVGNVEIDSLHAVIRVKSDEVPPDMIFVLTKEPGKDPFDPKMSVVSDGLMKGIGSYDPNDPNIPVVYLVLESFVRMSSLPKELQKQIREVLTARKNEASTKPCSLIEPE